MQNAPLPGSTSGSGTQDELLADVVRIDGGHTFEVAALDLGHAARLAKQGALLLLDDCEANEVNAAWQFALSAGIVEALHPGLGWTGQCVGRFL
mmetsp:Transcript_68178/g.154248  ORF Transcript_68178/g.154248 Transcript_68178/m.154248 type:complete len:94 (-) Transcript_68178:131-412(-)